MDLRMLAAAAALALTAWILASLHTSWRIRKKTGYMLDALEDGETGFRFQEKKWKTPFQINRTLNRLKGIYQNERERIREQESYFSSLLDHVRTGIIVINPKDGSICYTNTVADRLLGLSSAANLNQLRRIAPEAWSAFLSVSETREERLTLSDESQRRTYTLTASHAILGHREVKVIAINDISRDIESNETESQTRLLRVLTHEIMNTVTPIASLSEALAGSRSAESLPPDFRTGLATISASARGLISFVESYRTLLHIPAPVRKAIPFRDLADSVVRLLRERLEEGCVTCRIEERTEDVLLYIDEGQIRQILINLIKNAVQAGARRITVAAEIDAREQTLISVANDGRPVSRESREEIFTPFFTTKPEGTGLGLSISRQIMRLHNGTLVLGRSDESETVFTLIFR